MKKMDLINKILKNLPDIFIFLILIFTFILIIIFQKYNCLMYDDFIECSFGLDEGLFDNLLPNVRVHGGGYISLFLTKLMTFGIPFVFNIHPEDFTCGFNAVVKGILFVLFYFTSIKCCFLRSKNKWLFLTSLMFITFFSLYIFHSANYFCIKLNIIFYRYLFNTMFYFILFSYIYKNLIYGNSKYSFKEALLIIFSVIVTASGLETILFPFCLFFFLLFGYNKLIDLIFIFKKLELPKKIYKYNLNIKFYAPVILFYIIAFVYLKSPRFYANFEGRGLGSFNLSLKTLKEFFYIFYNHYILENIFLWILLILLIFGYLTIQKTILQKKKLLYSLLMIFSIISIYASLFLFGSNGYDGNYWINDFKLVIFFKIMMLAPVFILSDDFIRHAPYKYKSLLIKVFCWILLLTSLYYGFLLYNNRDYKPNGAVFKKVNYINEKMFMYFYLKKETPYLIKMTPSYRDELEGWYPFPFTEILEGENNYKNKEEICSYGVTRTSVYIERVYKININESDDKVKFCLSDDALERFFDLGGIITKDEIENIKFSRLKDPDYVLNNQVKSNDKMTKEDIIDIFKYYY